METSNILVLGIGLLILICIVVFAVELFLPINMRFEMNSILRPYMFEIESKGFVSIETEEEIQSKLFKIGLEDIQISVTEESKKFGEYFDLRISANYNRNSLIQLFRRELDTIKFNYERRLYVRKIIN